MVLASIKSQKTSGLAKHGLCAIAAVSDIKQSPNSICTPHHSNDIETVRDTIHQLLRRQYWPCYLGFVCSVSIEGFCSRPIPCKMKLEADFQN